jgi:hypothetical protein
MPNKDAVESLRTFAMQHNEIEFAHMCTAALEGKEWAIASVEFALSRIALTCADTGRLNTDEFEELQLRIIRATDTTRPDGAIARKFEI